MQLVFVGVYKVIRFSNLRCWANYGQKKQCSCDPSPGWLLTIK